MVMISAKNILILCFFINFISSDVFFVKNLPWVHFIEDNTIAQDYLITESPYMVLINEKRNIQFLGGKEKINLLITEILTANSQSSAVL